MDWSFEDHVDVCRTVLLTCGIELKIVRDRSLMPDIDRTFYDVCHVKGILWIFHEPPSGLHDPKHDFISALWHEVGHALTSNDQIRSTGINWTIDGKNPEDPHAFEIDACEMTAAVTSVLGVPEEDRKFILDFVMFNKNDRRPTYRAETQYIKWVHRKLALDAGLAVS